MIFIYSLVCPKTFRVRYIGKCKDVVGRFRAHLSKARLHQTDHHCARWIRNLLAEGLEPKIEILRSLDDDEDWMSIERELILEYRNRGYDLTNTTGGGDGFHKVRPDVLARRGRTRSATLQDPLKKQRFIESLKIAQSKPEVRAKHSVAAKGLWNNPSYREKAMSGMRRPDARQRRSDATRLRNSNPEFAAGHRERMRVRFTDPTAKEQLRQASLKRWSDWRANRSQK